MQDSTMIQTPDIRLLSAGSVRALGHVDTPLTAPVSDPEISQLLAILPKPEEMSGLLLSGGEPTLRKDLPALLDAMAGKLVPRLGLATDGLVLASDKAVQFLMDKGMKRVRIAFHSGRPDAHDWVAGMQGAAKRVHKSIRICVEAGLEVEIETLVTRPTVPYLEETIELLARMRVNRVILRRLSGRNNASDHFIAAAPRFGPSQIHLEGALRIAEGWDLETKLQDFPACSISNGSESFVLDHKEQWLAPDIAEWQSLLSSFELPKRVRGCRECPKDDTCKGAPNDYIRCFDRLELNNKSSMPTGKGEVSEEEVEWAKERLSNRPPPPPPRSGRTPATRRAFIQRQANKDLHGDPMQGVPIYELPDAVSEAFLDGELKRDIRVRLVRKSQEGAKTLRIVPPSLRYDGVGELLRDVTRLSFEHVEICGDGAGLKEVPDVDLRRLRRRISRFDIALLGHNAETHDAASGEPGSFEASLDAVKRLKAFARIKAGSYAIVTDDTELDAFEKAWSNEELPGEPAFRLSDDGGDMDKLVAKVKKLPKGATRNAIVRLIPSYLMPREPDVFPEKSWELLHGNVLERPEHHWRDRIGRFDSCILDPESAEKDQCPGLARNWKSSLLPQDIDSES